MKAILHCDKEWGIGKHNDLMFHIPEDMKFFKATTLGKVVVMGSNTLLSFHEGKPLVGRTNIVLWPNGDRARAEKYGYVQVESLRDLFAEVAKYAPDDVFVIGGAMMYHTLLPYCSEVLVTKVDAKGDAEVYFDNLDEMSEWALESMSDPIIDNGYAIRFCKYVNKEVKEF